MEFKEPQELDYKTYLQYLYIYKYKYDEIIDSSGADSKDSDYILNQFSGSFRPRTRDLSKIQKDFDIGDQNICDLLKLSKFHKIKRVTCQDLNLCRKRQTLFLIFVLVFLR